MRKVTMLVALILLVIPLAVLLFPLSHSMILTSTWYVSDVPQLGRRLVVHDNNVAHPISAYALLFEDTAGDLELAAWDYQDDTQLFIQEIVPANQWQSASGWNNFVASNIVAGQFWIVYQKTTSSIAAVQITFAYGTNGMATVVQSFLVGPPVILASGLPPMDNNVLDALIANDHTMWTAFIYTDSSNVQNIYLAQIYNNGTLCQSRTILLPSASGLVWNVQLAQTTSRVIVWASSNSQSAASVLGRVYDTSGTLLYTTVQFTYLYSTILSMMNGSAAIIFPMATTTWMDIVTVTDGHAISEDYSTLGPARYMTDVSAFNLPDNYIGIYFITLGGLFMTYYATSGFFGWVTPWIIEVVPNGGQFLAVSADRESLVQNSPAHPAVALFGYSEGHLGPGYQFVMLDIPVVNLLVTTTVHTTVTATAMTTLYSTAYAYNSTVAVTSNVLTVSLSKLQTPTFQFNLLILVLLLIVPAGVGGRLFGVLGMIVGAIGGTSAGMIAGLMPFWVFILIVFLLLVSVVLFRQKGWARG
jgi:hypothetical protein